MKLSLNWLKSFINIDKTPEQLADDLSLFGHEVEEIQKVGDDTVFNLEITPNRGDCLSVLGLAREIAAMYSINLKSQNANLKINEKNINKKIKVTVSDPKICPRYTARIIDNIEIKESPAWIQEKLKTYGFRPINNIVDITNFVMVAVGQPLHAFDYDKISEGEMVISQTNGNEELVTLDGKNRNLPEGTIIIKDSQKVYDLAGIMGGEVSEVKKDTKTIVLQGAIFNPILVRRASKKLNLTTDASYRYERGVDYEGTISGVDLAASLILESCPNAEISPLVDLKNEEITIPEIVIEKEKVNKLLGINIEISQMATDLERLNFRIIEKDDSKIKVIPPSYRIYDVNIWQDVAEEIARIYGYNNIAKNEFEKCQSEKNPEWLKREGIKDILENLGLTEVYSYSFADKDKIELLGFNLADCVEISNPLSPETRYLRPSLLPSLLTQVSKNPWSPEINVFEIEKVFSKDNEKWQVGMITVGKSDALIKDAISKLGISKDIEHIELNILAQYKIRRPVFYTLIDLDGIKYEAEKISEVISSNKYKPISKYPPTVRDLAFILDKYVKSEEIINEMLQINNQILLVEVFDEFSSEKFGENKKNVAFHVWLQDLKRPIENEKVNDIIKNIIKKIEDKFQAKLRTG